MFENLQDKLGKVFQKLRGTPRLTEENIQEAIGEVRMALLEADVNYKVARELIRRIREAAVGTEILQGATAFQQFVKIVHDELVRLLGGETERLEFPAGQKTVIMLCGLQGSGKTTTAGKLGLFLRKQGRHPLLVAADIYRPAAIEQLKVVGKQAEVPVHAPGPHVDPVEIARGGVQLAEKEGHDTVILDTAGRLHIDEKMMQELVRVRNTVKPRYILLVVDSMVGQDAVNQAKHFNELLEISGVILTKLDGDARGGAALSIREVTGKPILYAGIGEKLENFDRFYPDRMASRILGMGDILTLFERAREAFDQEQAAKMQQKLLDQSFTLDDFLKQMEQMKKMGGMQELLKMLPAGMGGGLPPDMEVDEKEFNRMKAIISSMTPEERTYPHIIGGSRRKRIATGSGNDTADVNRLLKEFDEMRKMVRQMMSPNGGRMQRLMAAGMEKAGQVMGKVGIKPARDRNKQKAKRKQEKQARKKGRKK